MARPEQASAVVPQVLLPGPEPLVAARSGRCPHRAVREQAEGERPAQVVHVTGPVPGVALVAGPARHRSQARSGACRRRWPADVVAQAAPAQAPARLDRDRAARVGVGGRSAVWTGVGSSGRSSAGSAAGLKARGWRPVRDDGPRGRVRSEPWRPSSTTAQVQENPTMSSVLGPRRAPASRAGCRRLGPVRHIEPTRGRWPPGRVLAATPRPHAARTGGSSRSAVLADDHHHERRPLHLGEVLLDLGLLGAPAPVAVLGLGRGGQHGSKASFASSRSTMNRQAQLRGRAQAAASRMTARRRCGGGDTGRWTGGP